MDHGRGCCPLTSPLPVSLPPPPLLGKDHIIFGTLALLTLPIIIAVIIMIIYLFAVASLRGGGRSYIKSMSVDVLSHVEKQQVGLIHGTTLVLFLFVSFSV